TAVVVLVTSAMSAYALARLRFPGRGTVFTVLVGSLMIPNAVVLVPQYVLVQQLGWLSTFQGLIVPEAATTFAFGVFLLRQFFLTMPGELEDAARIDGANAWQVFTRIVLPLSQPVLAALGIFAFRSAWNDFLWPLIAVNKPDMFPLPAARLLDGTGAAAVEQAALLIDGDRVADLGRASDVHVADGASVERRDYGAATILPGLVDAHTHLVAPGDGTLGDDVAREDDDI